MGTKRKKREEIVTAKGNFDRRPDSRAIIERNRVVLAYMELAQDRTFQRLSEEQKFNLIHEVISLGDKVAGWIVKEYGTRDPRKVAAKLGLKIFGEDRGRMRGAEYRKDSGEIIVYRSFHNKLMREVKSPELSRHLLKFIIAHELFHYLEEHRIGEVFKRYKFDTWRIGPFTKQKVITKLSDVAAQAFTQSLLELEISPEVFDYLTYILYSRH